MYEVHCLAQHGSTDANIVRDEFKDNLRNATTERKLYFFIFIFI